MLDDNTENKYITDDFVLNGTLNLKNFISPIRTDSNSNHLAGAPYGKISTSNTFSTPLKEITKFDRVKNNKMNPIIENVEEENLLEDANTNQKLITKFNLETLINPSSNSEGNDEKKEINNRKRVKSMPNSTKSESPAPTRTSKRVKINSNDLGVYEFETIKDFQGKILVVPKLVGVKNGRGTTQSLSVPIIIPKKKTSTKEIKINKNEHLMLKDSNSNESKFQVFSFNKSLEKKDYKKVSVGVELSMISDDDGILCIYPKSECRTQRHVSDVLYVVRQGQCLFLINGTETLIEKGEVVKVPKNIKYKVKNLQGDQNSFAHFQFL